MGRKAKLRAKAEHLKAMLNYSAGIIAGLKAKLADTTACNERQALKLADLEERLAEWQDAAATAAGEKCLMDDTPVRASGHCACVPLLRVELRNLQELKKVYGSQTVAIRNALREACTLDQVNALELDGAVALVIRLLQDEVGAASSERERLLGEREELRAEVKRLKRFEERFEEERAAKAAREVGQNGFYERTFLHLTSAQRDEVIVLFDAAETPTSELLNFVYQVGPDGRVMSRRPSDVYTGW
jgi:hypothetical protein